MTLEKGKILVVGASGMLGEPVARKLREDGYEVRLFVRDLARAQQRFGAGFEYILGEVSAEPTLQKALQGCTGVHISLQADSAALFDAVEHQGTARIAHLARELGVNRISYLSGALVSAQTALIPQQRAKYLAEQAIERSGVPYTIFKPTYFMESLPLNIQGKRAVIMGKSERPFRFVAAVDFASMVSRAFRTPEAANQRLFVYGPQAMTLREAMQTYCRIAAPHVQISVTPLSMMTLIDTLFMGGNLRPVIQLARLNQDWGEIGDATLTNQLLGASTTTLEQWCYQRTGLQVSA
ncbi:MAG: NAD(P)H-binding protein [Anaerolinea sp.]|nr:NAD(P)H-binding protein [Anaerolinea sp.]